MLTKPRWILHLESAAVFVTAIYFYHAGHFSWGLFAALFLAPDLSMLGYLKDAKWGLAVYNVVHTLAGPLRLIGIESAFNALQYLPYTLTWLAPIGMDRALGYGLKYPTFFKDTHLQRV